MTYEMRDSTANNNNSAGPDRSRFELVLSSSMTPLPVDWRGRPYVLQDWIWVFRCLSCDDRLSHPIAVHGPRERRLVRVSETSMGRALAGELTHYIAHYIRLLYADRILRGT